jgi:hypothetical protein
MDAGLVPVLDDVDPDAVPASRPPSFPRAGRAAAGHCRPGPLLPPELAALAAAGLPSGPLIAALAESERSGGAPFDILLATGSIPEEALIRALARGLGVDTVRPSDLEGPPLDADSFALALRTGVLQTWDEQGCARLLVAARGHPVARLAVARRGTERNLAIALISPRSFADIAVGRAGAALAQRACEGPARLFPKLTVGGGLPRVGFGPRIALTLLAALTVVLLFAIDTAGVAALTLLGLLFGLQNAFRLWLACTPPLEAGQPPVGDDRDLPVYTVLVALAREGAVVPGLLDALERLDYPAPKLDIKLLIEEGDQETLAALAARPPRPGVEVLVLPPGGPKTKPRALNAGLLAARGRLLTVFDAEDRPEPGQLRLALDAFRKGPENLACVQARLAIDNLDDGWLVRHFAIEYAALFDVCLPALATLGLPIALGGTSNHFRGIR